MAGRTAMITDMGIPTVILITGTAMTDQVSASSLYRLMAFLSPAFPIGAFTYSHGLEKVIDEGGVTNVEEFGAWLEEILRVGGARSDAILVKESYRAARSGNGSAVKDLRELGLALQPSKERHLETSAQGRAFFEAIARSWLPSRTGAAAGLLKDLVETDDRGPWPYPVTVGVTCAAHEIPEEAALTAYLHAFAANLVSAAVRAVPLGQNSGQKVLSDLEPLILGTAKSAQEMSLDDLGTSTFLADIASMAHETQYSRLFRS
ncbi:urease accessory protein UreF [Roseibium sp.]|uniref:urease accessory protein UreF n=1 Tax=Roseibium sp. TaxID=1936156 RepID=UPI0025F59280|nr:urease accessory protein UreF [Roseibium sp.]